MYNQLFFTYVEIISIIIYVHEVEKYLLAITSITGITQYRWYSPVQKNDSEGLFLVLYKNVKVHHQLHKGYKLTFYYIHYVLQRIIENCNTLQFNVLSS